MHGHGLSNEMQDQGKAVLASNMAARGFICTEHYFAPTLVLKVGVLYGCRNV